VRGGAPGAGALMGLMQRSLAGVGDEVSAELLGGVGDCDGDARPDIPLVFRSPGMMTDRLVLVRFRGATPVTDSIVTTPMGTTFDKFARWY
jgi:hypothetical protein